MNKERLKKMIFDLKTTLKDLDKSLEMLAKFGDDEDMKSELSNSLKYKYLSMFIIYEDFISMMLKEYGLFEIGMSVDKALKKLNETGKIDENQYRYLNTARIIRNKIGHRYKQPTVEEIVASLNNNSNVRKEFCEFIEMYMQK
ncbi:HepT-like ribonuclease domain-containing protein [Clostridium butyricum]|jgi:uncharacterized protein YutE (UPF0331/DUF86 family)|uniref:HepT-like ribonuclease domain-containing protein n=1 Tax=Clostridium butyricum TaxID=1492 RepID=UPI001558F82D|nr:HepT-like ribonuclease domain-containing protein [Clostridium butyricum]